MCLTGTYSKLRARMGASVGPLVSICIPTHNDARVVSDALRSAMRQEYAPLEVLVVDNCSTDETWTIVQDITATDRRVRVSRNPENIGMARNFNACIESAAGSYVMILCADDVLEKGCAEFLAGALNDHPDAALAACGRTLTDPELRPVRVSRARQRKEVVAPADMLRECFVHGNRIGEPSAVMFRREAALRGFDPTLSQAIDIEMWFHLLDRGAAVLLPEAFSLIRQHGNQMTQANIPSGRIVRDKQLLFRRYAPRILSSLSVAEKLTWDARMASSLARTRAAGGQVNENEISEIFYPEIFSRMLCPLIDLGWRVRAMFGSQRL